VASRLRAHPAAAHPVLAPKAKPAAPAARWHGVSAGGSG